MSASAPNLPSPARSRGIRAGAGASLPRGVGGGNARRTATAGAVLGALAILHLWPVAGPGRLPENLDLMLQYVPNAAHLARGLAIGTIPLWNPWQGGGAPFAANPGSGAWYPPLWALLASLPIWDAVRGAIWLHLAVGVTGTWRCLRGPLRASRPGAVAGTAAFALSPWMPGLAGMPVMLTGLAWLPWVIDAGLRLVEAPRLRLRGVAALALVTAAAASGGWPAATWLAWFVLAGATALGVVPVPGWPSVRGLAVAFGRLAAAGTLATAIAAVVLVPAAELVGETTYAATRPVGSVADDGYLTLLSWLRPAAGKGAMEGGQASVGVAALVLAATAPVFLRHDVAGRAGLRAWGTIAAVAIVLSWGTRSPLFGAAYAWLPGFRILYLPARLGIVAAFAIACLAAAVIDRLGNARAPGARRDARTAVAIAAALPVATLAQFWHSEGYDDFRRLLTNLWRVTGSPFLSVAQEAHAVAAGVATVAVLVAATRTTGTRRRFLGTALAAAVVADLGALAIMSSGPAFDPVAWYRPAFEAAPAVRDAIGHDRYAGLPWHVEDHDAPLVRHFLGDFPASARPATLPPNLGLLVGVRDAQAYDPLILKATARAFAAGGAPDDHWAWLARFDPGTTRPLAIREVLAAPPAAWRVPAVPLGAATAACCDAVIAWDGGAPVAWDRAWLSAFLGEATTVAQGVTVAEVILDRTDGTVVIPLRAGIEVAEWAYDRPDVRGTIPHARAPVALVTRVVGAVGGRYDTYEYLTSVPNVTGAPLQGVRLRAVVPGVAVHLAQVAIDPPGAPWRASPLGWRDDDPAASRLRVEPSSAGTAAWVSDEVDRLEITASLRAPARIVVADAPYPGWRATVDGVAIPLAADGAGTFARIVDVPAGDHLVVLDFDPPTVAIGRAVSLSGLAVAALLLVGRRPGRLRRGNA